MEKLHVLIKRYVPSWFVSWILLSSIVIPPLLFVCCYKYLDPPGRSCFAALGIILDLLAAKQLGIKG